MQVFFMQEDEPFVMINRKICVEKIAIISLFLNFQTSSVIDVIHLKQLLKCGVVVKNFPLANRFLYCLKRQQTITLNSINSVQMSVSKCTALTRIEDES
jgi:hypothetical protein